MPVSAPSETVVVTSRADAMNVKPASAMAARNADVAVQPGGQRPGEKSRFAAAKIDLISLIIAVCWVPCGNDEARELQSPYEGGS